LAAKKEQAKSKQIGGQTMQEKILLAPLIEKHGQLLYRTEYVMGPHWHWTPLAPYWNACLTVVKRMDSLAP
jgi:hypothetical protein